VTDDSGAAPAAALRAIVADAVDGDLADDAVRVVGRTGDGGGGPVPEGRDAGGGGPVSEGRDAGDGGPKSERPNDAAPIDLLVEAVDGAGSLVAVVPRIDARLASRLDGALERDGSESLDARIVFTGRAADRLQGATGSVARAALAARGVETYRHDGDSPVAVVLADDRAAVGLVDDDGVAALLASDASTVREWAAATCGRYLAAADPVSGA